MAPCWTTEVRAVPIPLLPPKVTFTPGWSQEIVRTDEAVHPRAWHTPYQRLLAGSYAAVWGAVVTRGSHLLLQEGYTCHAAVTLSTSAVAGGLHLSRRGDTGWLNLSCCGDRAQPKRSASHPPARERSGKFLLGSRNPCLLTFIILLDSCTLALRVQCFAGAAVPR